MSSANRPGGVRTSDSARSRDADQRATVGETTRSRPDANHDPPPRLGRTGLLVVFASASLGAWWFSPYGGCQWDIESTHAIRSTPAMRWRDAAGSLQSPRITHVQRKAGFDLRGVIVPIRELRSGGPAKDGIPALTGPRFIPGAFATYLAPQDRVIGVVVGPAARAYPLSILAHHEIVNDRIGDLPIAVTYCPLCDSAVVFDRRTPIGEREFGVSGLLFNSNVLMYDRRGRPESLWSQVMAAGISGPAAGRFLTALPLEVTTWTDWLTRNPRTTVLSPATGFGRDYRRNPYARYFSRPTLMFPVRPMSNLLPAKTAVLGLWTDNAARAYALFTFRGAPREFQDVVGGKKVTIVFNPEANSLRVAKSEKGVSWMYSFWFAWYAFRPTTDLFRTR